MAMAAVCALWLMQTTWKCKPAASAKYKLDECFCLLEFVLLQQLMLPAELCQCRLTVTLLAII